MFKLKDFEDWLQHINHKAMNKKQHNRKNSRAIQGLVNKKENQQ